MSREIKFRVWCLYKHEWEDAECFLDREGCLFYYNNGIKKLRDKDHIIQLNTGLTDSRNREIYEGDILSYDGRDGYAEVKFGDGKFFLEGKNLTWIDLFCDKERWERTDVEGNIFENPELLYENP